MLKKVFRWIFKSELQQLELQIQKNKDLVANLELINKKIFESESRQLNLLIQKSEDANKRISNVLNNFDVSVDVHEYSPSWAVISLQGKSQDYIKFIDLGNSDIKEIMRFLRQFERDANIKVDANPVYCRVIKSMEF